MGTPRTGSTHHVLVWNAPCEEVDALRLLFVSVLEVHFHSLPQGTEDVPTALTLQGQGPPRGRKGHAEGGQGQDQEQKADIFRFMPMSVRGQVFYSQWRGGQRK